MIFNIINNSDIIINIGNNIINQVPSKIFEYIESKKVILNIASIENDTSKFYLEKYDLAILINESNDSEIHKKNIEKVVFNYKNYQDAYLSNDDIINKFNDYTAEKISEKISNRILK